MFKQLYTVSEGNRSLTMYQCENDHAFGSFDSAGNPGSCHYCDAHERRKAIEEKNSIVFDDDGAITCTRCNVEIYNPFDYRHEDFRVACACGEHCDVQPKRKRKRHNLKRREKAKERKAERRAALLAADGGLIGVVVDLLKTEMPELTPDIYLIKRILDKIEFPNLCERLALLCDEDKLKALQGVAEAHKWNRAEQKYLETILTLACVLAEEEA